MTLTLMWFSPDVVRLWLTNCTTLVGLGRVPEGTDLQPYGGAALPGALTRMNAWKVLRYHVLRVDYDLQNWNVTSSAWALTSIFPGLASSY